MVALTFKVALQWIHGTKVIQQAKNEKSSEYQQNAAMSVATENNQITPPMAAMVGYHGGDIGGGGVGAWQQAVPPGLLGLLDMQNAARAGDRLKQSASTVPKFLQHNLPANIGSLI